MDRVQAGAALADVMAGVCAARCGAGCRSEADDRTAVVTASTIGAIQLPTLPIQRHVEVCISGPDYSLLKCLYTVVQNSSSSACAGRMPQRGRRGCNVHDSAVSPLAGLVVRLGLGG